MSVTERREIARAIMESLALTSNRLGATGNPLAVLASYFRYIVADWLGDNLLSLLFNQEHPEDKPDPTLLAFACLVVALEYQLPATPSLPERQWLQLPLSVSQLFIKARRYWSLLNNIALPAKAINSRAQGSAAQLAFVPQEKSRGATRDISGNQAPHCPRALTRPWENHPCAPPCVQQTWVRKGVPAAGLCRKGPRAVHAPTPECLSTAKRAVDAGALAPQGYMTLPGAVDTLLRRRWVWLSIPEEVGRKKWCCWRFCPYRQRALAPEAALIQPPSRPLQPRTSRPPHRLIRRASDGSIIHAARTAHL